MSRTGTLDSRTDDQECRFFLWSPPGISAVVSSHGAGLVGLVAPDRQSRFADVVLGYDRRADYVANGDMYFGCTVGRVAQRIGQARFRLDGVEYTLAANNGRNHLHGGAARSFDKVNWHGSTRTTSEGQEVEFTYVSPHLEEGYPGRVDARVIYRLTPDGEVQIIFVATTDRPTPISLTNHSYWNLADAGSPTILDHELTIWADRYTPTDDELIPTGAVVQVDGTPLDMRKPVVIRDRIDNLKATGGFDHNLVLSPDRPDGLAARLRDPASGRVLEIRTDQPCIQLYSGNFMRSTVGKMGARYGYRSALCLEPAGYPDAVNHPTFESVILQPGSTYCATTRYRLLFDSAHIAD